MEYGDLENVSNTSFNEGKIEGKIEEKRKIARKMLAENIPVDLISKLTALTMIEIETLKDNDD